MNNIVSTHEIVEHPLLDRDHQHMVRTMRNAAKREKRGQFTMLDFAQICLRATARNYTEAEDNTARATSDLELRRAAILYVYEAMKACDIALIKQWPEFREMLSCIALLHGDLP